MNRVKITFGEMRDSGTTGIFVFCNARKCSHMIKIADPQWADDVRLSDIEDRFICQVCGNRGAEVKPDFGAPKMGAR